MLIWVFILLAAFFDNIWNSIEHVINLDDIWRFLSKTFDIWVDFWYFDIWRYLMIIWPHLKTETFTMKPKKCKNALFFASSSFLESVYHNDFASTKIFDINQNSQNSRNLILPKIYTLNVSFYQIEREREKFIEILQVVQKRWRFSPSISTIFIDLSDFLTFPYFKETNKVSIYRWCQSFFTFNLL